MELDGILRRVRLRVDSAFLALLAIGTALVVLVSLRHDQVPAFTGWFLFVPLLILLLAVVRALPATTPSRAGEIVRRLQSLEPVWPVAAAALTVSFTVAQFANNAGPKDNYWPAFGLWAVAVLGTLTAALLPLFPSLTKKAQVREWLLAHKWELAVVAVLTVAALVPRLVNLSSEPTPYSGDEAAVAAQAVRVLDGQNKNMFISGVQGHATMQYFTVAAVFKVFGVTTFSSRLLAALAGAITVPLLYLFLRQMFDRTIGLLGATYLVGYHFQLHFSRMGLENIADPLFMVAVLYFAWRASRQGKAMDFALTGLVMGLGLYLSPAARVIPLVVAAFFAYCILRRPAFLRQAVPGAGLMALAYGAAALPVGVFWITHQNEFMDRINVVGIFQSGWIDRHSEATGESTLNILWDQAVHAFGGFGRYTDAGLFYRAPIPLVDRLSLLPFLLGIAYALYRILEERCFLLLTMFVAVIVTGGVLTLEPPNAQRLLGTIPAVVAFTAIGLKLLADALTPWRPTMAPVFAAVGVGALLASNLSFYFTEYRTGGYYSDYNTRVATQVAEYVKTLPEDTRVFWYGDPQIFISGTGHPAMTFPLRDRPRFDVLQSGRVVSSPTLGPVVADAPAVFLFMPHRQAEMEPLIESCPGGETKTFISKAGRKGLNGIQKTDQTSFTAYEVLTPNRCLPLSASASTGG